MPTWNTGDRGGPVTLRAVTAQPILNMAVNPPEFFGDPQTTQTDFLGGPPVDEGQIPAWRLCNTSHSASHLRRRESAPSGCLVSLPSLLFCLIYRSYLCFCYMEINLVLCCLVKKHNFFDHTPQHMEVSGPGIEPAPQQ